MRNLVKPFLIAGLLLAPLASASAHALLKTAEPAVGSTVSPGPAQLQLHYTEGVEIHFSGVTVTDSSGKPVEPVKLATAPDNPATVLVTLPGALPAGRYKVSWHVVSVDTHKTQGDYSFTVGGAGPAAALPAGIQIVQPWARATAGSLGTGIVYLTLANSGTADDELLSASTPVAGMAELHQSVEQNGIATMPAATGIPVKAGGKAVLAPGGFHIMLMELKQPLKEGESFPITLTFAKAGKMTATVSVLAIGATAPAGDPGGTGDMPGMKM